MIWQLSAGEQWDQLKDFLADPTWLHELWNQDPEDVLTYWRRIEERSSWRIAQTYEDAVADPSCIGILRNYSSRSPRYSLQLDTETWSCAPLITSGS